MWSVSPHGTGNGTRRLRTPTLVVIGRVPTAGTCHCKRVAARLWVVSATLTVKEHPSDPPRATLGSVVYPAATKGSTPESLWVSLIRSMAAGDQAALRELYQRTHGLVFTLAMRLTQDKHISEELTLDVFHDLWRRAAEYDPAGGTVVGWIMNQARSRALDRMRFERRQKRVNPFPDDPAAAAVDSSDHLVESGQRGAVLRAALGVLSPQERKAIELAFFSENTYAQVAVILDEPLGTVKTRIRTGLLKLREALASRQDGS
jgi:RNA polymerase sigma-70 factor, ECF subfamily